MPEPSHKPCPMCGKDEESTQDVFDEVTFLADRAVENLKFLHLGFYSSYLMTDLERSVFFYHQIKREKFKDVARILKRSEGSVKMAWKRCKLKIEKALEESSKENVYFFPYI
mgnify:FL=1